ncbi:MAG: hypothetical protein HWN81_03180 [Candidatus Lokiarchaeota archaeon]|nr:hypothetical protein [Candidatus Lokiarchaeota archaeon]
MTLSPQDYERIMEDNLKEELEWLEEEFEQLFKKKKENYSQEDITIGNRILDQVIDGIKTNNREELLNLLAITLNRIEHDFPEFF